MTTASEMLELLSVQDQVIEDIKVSIIDLLLWLMTLLRDYVTILAAWAGQVPQGDETLPDKLE